MVFNYSSVPWMWSYWRTSVVFQWFHHQKANRYHHPPSSSPFYPPSSSSSTPAARPRTLHRLQRRFLRALVGSKNSHHLKNSQHTTHNYKSPNNSDNMKTQSVFYQKNWNLWESQGLHRLQVEGVVGVWAWKWRRLKVWRIAWKPCWCWGRPHWTCSSSSSSRRPWNSSSLPSLTKLFSVRQKKGIRTSVVFCCLCFWLGL